MLKESWIEWEIVAKQAYKAYGATTNHKNYQGLPMPQWEQLPPTIQQAWINSCKSTYSWLEENNP